MSRKLSNRIDKIIDMLIPYTQQQEIHTVMWTEFKRHIIEIDKITLSNILYKVLEKDFLFSKKRK